MKNSVVNGKCKIMNTNNRTIPNDEDGNPFLTLTYLIDNGKSVATLATAIEQHGIYTWDRFGRFGLASDAGKIEALRLLEVVHEWDLKGGAASHEDPRSPHEQHGDERYNPWGRFGWATEVAPDFANIRQTQTEEEPKQIAKLRRRAPDAFVAAILKLFVEIAKKDPKLKLDKMPGIKLDLHEVAIKFDANLDHPISTFDTYIERLCQFKHGSRSSNYYQTMFPEYFK